MSSDASHRRPRLHPRFAVRTDGESGFLLSERDVIRLRGAAYARLLPFMDGSHRLGDIPSLLAGACSPTEVYYLVERLRRGGYLSLLDNAEDGAAGNPSSIFWEALDGRASSPAARVGVMADGWAGQAARQAVEECGLVCDGDAASADALLIVADDQGSSAWCAAAESAWHRNQPSLVVGPAGTEIRVGPLLVPGTTACPACLRARLRSHRRLHALLEQRAGHAIPIPAGRLDATVGIAVRMAAFELVRWLGRSDDRDAAATLEGSLLTLDLRTMTTARHPVAPMPGCPACGTGLARPAPERLVSRLTGVVAELRCLSGDGDVVRIWSAGPNVAYPVSDVEAFLTSERAVALGRGLTDASARAGAIGEAVERYSATFRGDEPVLIASMQDLGDAAIDPQTLLNFSDRQYACRSELNARAADRRQLIPARLDPSQPIAWTEVRRLADGSLRYLPTTCCYLGYGQRRTDWDAVADSNGTAAGASRAAAIRHAWLEVVERDAVAIWWYNRLPRPGVDVAGLGDPWVDVILAEHRRRGLRTSLLDLTTDLQVPVVAAISALEGSGDPPVVVTGFAAADSLAAAARGALLEASQMAALVDPADAAAGGWVRLSLSEHRYLRPDETLPVRRADALPVGRADALPVRRDDALPVRRADALPVRRADTLPVRRADALPVRRVDALPVRRDDALAPVAGDEAAIEAGVAAAARAGLEVFLLDLSRADTGLPVVKVFVPGARHFWPRFGPGRLYDVPVRMGAHATPLCEAEMNDGPIPF